MLDTMELNPPPALKAILDATAEFGFSMSSEVRTGAFLRVLAAGKPGGRILEFGTGTGVATAWMLDGMDRHARLRSIDNDPALLEIAKKHLGNDDRVEFVPGDAADAINLAGKRQERFDLIFADTWAGKFTHLEATLSLLRRGGLYVVDDLLMQPSWPIDHAEKVFSFINSLAGREDLQITRMNWSTGLLIAVKRAS